MPAAISITRPTYTDVDSLSATAANNVWIVSANVPDATGATEGVIRLAGDLGGTAAAPEIGALKVTAAKLANDAVETAKVKDKAVTLPKLADMATDNLIGRSTAGAGVPELVPCTAVGRSLLAAATQAAGQSALGLGAMAANSLSVLTSTASNVTLTGTAGAARVFNALGAPQLNLTAGKWLVIGTLPVRTTDVVDEVKLEFSDNGGANAFGAGATVTTNTAERRPITVVGVKTVAAGTFSVFMKATPGAAGGTLDMGSADPAVFAGTLLAIRLEGP